MRIQTGPMASCTKCRVEQPATTEFFPSDPRVRSGLSSWCRDCCRARARKKQAERRADPLEREKVREEKRRHSQSEKGRRGRREATLIANHKRRQAHLPTAKWDWSLDAWRRCLRAFNHACAYCETRDARLVHDHFIPLSDPACPGAVPQNIIPACPSCNGRKARARGNEWASAEALARIQRYFEEVSR